VPKLTTIIFAVYESESYLREDTLEFLELVSQNQAFKLLLVYNGSLLNLGKLADSIIVIPNPVQGYDLNCYIRGFLYSREVDSDSFIFLNNSIYITHPKVFLSTILLIDRELDFWPFVGFSMSKEIRKHFQSFLFGINFSSNPWAKVKLFEICEHNDKAFTRQEVIENFELKSYDYVTKLFDLKYHLIFKPGLLLKVKAYFTYLITFGFLDNMRGLTKSDSINYSLFLKNTIEKKYGFKKIKSTSILNKFK
jgi:hypothetical protein